MKSKIGDKLTKVVQRRAEVLSKAVYGIASNIYPQGTTPVFTGNFVSNWTVAIGSPDTSQTGADKKTNVRYILLNVKPVDAVKVEFAAADYSLRSIHISNAVKYSSTIQQLGTKYSDPNILGRITDNFGDWR